jgi:endonuclease YncB( thermonuclease family)
MEREITTVRPYPIRPSFASLVLFFLFAPAKACAAEPTDRVASVAYGDAITILDTSRKQNKIRVAGIDAPENREHFGTGCTPGFRWE